MSPPELAADAPVLDVLEPVEVNFAPALGEKLDVAVADRGLRFLDARITQPPLPREARLDRHIGAFRIAHVVRVRFLRDECATFLEQLGGFLAAGETIHARELDTREGV